jgi:hypothetical protein
VVDAEEAVAIVDQHVLVLIDDEVLAATLGDLGQLRDRGPFHGASS